MPDGRGSRFAVEVVFLVALAVALALADLRPLEIAGVMLAGWVIVAALEWAAWRDEPHYGSGLPPRYYVPHVSLPPPQPLEQVAAGYPEARDEAPTWIASAALREEMLGEWPVAIAREDDDPLYEPEEPLHEPEPVVDHDPWTHAEELPVAPLDELEEEEHEHEPQRVAVAVEPQPEPEPEPALVLTAIEGRTARYRLDPLAEQQPRRRFRRGRQEEAAALEVPARPAGIRALPGRANRQD